MLLPAALLLSAASAAQGAASICRGGDGTLTAVVGPCPPSHPSPARIAGVNIFDSLWVTSTGQPTCCNASGGPATRPDAFAALSSAKASGVKVFRFFAGLWGPWMKFWVTNETTYWAEFDALFDEIDRLGLYTVPSVGYSDWHKVANAALGTNETANDMVRNASSVSRGLALKYFDQIVRRYSARQSVLIWELGNELNLQVNLPPPWCGDEQCFNTAEMVVYTGALAATIRAVDARRPVSSGYSLPRPTAWHQEHCPLQGCKEPGGYWGTDTREQWLEILAAQNAGMDLWSVHSYAGTDCWFDRHNCTAGAALVAAASGAAKKANAVLYVGEYGGPAPNFTGPTDAAQAFPAAMLSEQVADRHASGAFTLSTIWAFACPSHRGDMVCIWPGSTRAKEAGSDRMLQIIGDAQAKLDG